VLARVWLTGPGDACATCAMAAECPERTWCLHLVASAGLTTRLDGPFRRFPLGARDVGRVPVTRQAFLVTEPAAMQELAERTWLVAHRVHGFAAVPVEYGDACIGVLAVFSRDSFPRREAETLAHLARLGGVALGNVRAFRDLATERNRLVARAARGGAAEPERVSAAPEGAIGAPGGAGMARDAADALAAERLLRPWAETEREILGRVLAQTRGRVSGPRGAAAVLGLKPTTLFSRMKRLGVPRKPA
jgi:transcriptional regulator with GAF, ATPase, and Fis domain